MGCGLSKLDPEEAGLTCSIDETTSAYDHRDEETNSSARYGCRKSVSSTTSERGFLRKVLGSNDKERGVEREMQPSLINNGRKSVSSVDQERRFDIMKKEILRERKFGKQVVDMAIEDGRNNNINEEKWRSDNEGEDVMREDSILFSPGSPSFRVYCIRNNQSLGLCNGDNSDKENKTNSPKEIKKRSEIQPLKRGRKGKGLGTAIRRGGRRAGMRSFLDGPGRSSASPTSRGNKLVA